MPKVSGLHLHMHRVVSSLAILKFALQGATEEQTNTPFEVAERALAHKTASKVVAAYARSDLFEKRRELMGRWAEYLANKI